MSASIQGKAAGAFNVSTFVKLDTASNQGFVSAADATKPIMGIASEAAQNAPIPSNANTLKAAEAAGDEFHYYPANSSDPVRLLCSGGWTAGDMIVPTTGGAGATVSGTTAAQFVGAIAVEACNDQEYGLVLPVNFPYTAT